MVVLCNNHLHVHCYIVFHCNNLPPSCSSFVPPVTKLCPTLCGPMDYSPPGSSVHGILQAKILEWVAISFFRGSSWSRDRTLISCIGGRILNHWATWEALPALHPSPWFLFQSVLHRVVKFWSLTCPQRLKSIWNTPSTAMRSEPSPYPEFHTLQGWSVFHPNQTGCKFWEKDPHCSFHPHLIGSEENARFVPSVQYILVEWP